MSEIRTSRIPFVEVTTSPAKVAVPVLERLSLMELILGRALARCGSGEGYDVLIDYLDDMRAVLAEFAHNALVKVSSQDYGKDKKAWIRWLNSNKNRLQPVVLKERPNA